MLEKVSISSGKMIIGGVQIALGVKDIPPHLVPDGYIPQLRWISGKYFVFWDEQSKRGWLVNGTSTLLHLVRATLHHYQNSDFSDALLFDPDKLKEAKDQYRPNSANSILTDEENLELKIWVDKVETFDETAAEQEGNQVVVATKRKSYFLFQHLVNQQFDVLQKIIDHQRHAAGENGINLKLRARKHLEGWDFKNLVTSEDLYPGVVTLQALGYGWVDFVRSIDAVTLFGRGFGDIIRPISSLDTCLKWNCLPRDWYLLGASVFEMKKITRPGRCAEDLNIRSVHDLLWSYSETATAKCECTRNNTETALAPRKQEHCDPVQVFYPRMKISIAPKKRSQALGNYGAVAFGHSKSWKYRWTNHGDVDIQNVDSTSNLTVEDSGDAEGSSSNVLLPTTSSQDESSHISTLLSPTDPSTQVSSQSSVTPSTEAVQKRRRERFLSIFRKKSSM